METKDFQKANTIIQILTEQRNNALNQVVALRAELIETKEELSIMKKEMMDKEDNCVPAEDPIKD